MTTRRPAPRAPRLLPFALLLAGLLLASPAARAALTQAQLDQVELAPPQGAQLPTDLALVDEAGRPTTIAAALDGHPALLVMADYTCTTLCGTALGVAAEALAHTGLTPGEGFRYLAIGLDPRDGPADAAAMKHNFLGGDSPALLAATHFLGGPAEALGAVARALHYRAVFDPDDDRYAHPTGAIVLTADGRVSRVLDNFSLDPDTLRLALVDASQGQLGTLGDRVRLLCYGLGPAHGLYNGTVARMLSIGSGVTIAALALFVLWLVRQNRRRRAA
ncbi:SCO family protein [Roseomonas elaeocarpi]|uniref:SCO family protein n=1 Tax=Roseomonas elaeocarpi TaxID=907779 RepID=A0ABV6JY69_9PROT